MNRPIGPEETWPDKMMYSCDLGFTELALGEGSQGNNSRGIVISETAQVAAVRNWLPKIVFGIFCYHKKFLPGVRQMGSSFQVRHLAV